MLDSNANIEVRNGHGHTPLLVAAREGHEDVVRLLVENGADIPCICGVEETPLICAVWHLRVEVVYLLLAKGAPVNTKNHHDTALHRAAHRGQEDLVRTLLDAGADLTVKPGLGLTVLDQAVNSGHEGVILLLLDAISNIDNWKDDYEPSALRYATQGCAERTIEILLDRGIDVNATISGKTALDIALELSMPSTKQLNSKLSSTSDSYKEAAKNALLTAKDADLRLQWDPNVNYQQWAEQLSSIIESHQETTMIALLLPKHARPRLQWDPKCLNVQQWGEQPWFPKLESIIAVANEELSVSTTSPDVHAERKDFIVVKHNSKQDQPYLELTISRTDLPSHVRGIEFRQNHTIKVCILSQLGLSFRYALLN